MAAWLIWSLLSARLLVSASPEQKNITAASGQNVTLPCRVSFNNTKTVEWSRDDLEKEYVFLIRDGVLLLTNQHPLFKDRVELQDKDMKDRNVSVILKNVTVNDTGTYECRVGEPKPRRKRTNLDDKPICIINLSVDDPGPSGGVREDGGKEDGGTAGLIAGLSVAAVLLAAVAFMSYRKYKDNKSRASC